MVEPAVAPRRQPCPLIRFGWPTTVTPHQVRSSGPSSPAWKPPRCYRPRRPVSPAATRITTWSRFKHKAKALLTVQNLELLSICHDDSLKTMKSLGLGTQDLCQQPDDGEADTQTDDGAATQHCTADPGTGRNGENHSPSKREPLVDPDFTLTHELVLSVADRPLIWSFEPIRRCPEWQGPCYRPKRRGLSRPTGGYHVVGRFFPTATGRPDPDDPSTVWPPDDVEWVDDFFEGSAWFHRDGVGELEFRRLPGPWQYEVRIELVDGEPLVAALGISHKTGIQPTTRTAITSSHLRNVPMALLLRGMNKALRGDPAGWAQQSTMAIQQASGKSWPAEHYLEVAEVSWEAEAEGRAPRDAIAEKWNVSKPTASRWRRRARELGFLPAEVPRQPERPDEPGDELPNDWTWEWRPGHQEDFRRNLELTHFLKVLNELHDYPEARQELRNGFLDKVLIPLSLHTKENETRKRATMHRQAEALIQEITRVFGMPEPEPDEGDDQLTWHEYYQVALESYAEQVNEALTEVGIPTGEIETHLFDEITGMILTIETKRRKIHFYFADDFGWCYRAGDSEFAVLTPRPSSPADLVLTPETVAPRIRDVVAGRSWSNRKRRTVFHPRFEPELVSRNEAYMDDLLNALAVYIRPTTEALPPED